MYHPDNGSSVNTDNPGDPFRRYAHEEDERQKATDPEEVHIRETLGLPCEHRGPRHLSVGGIWSCSNHPTHRRALQNDGASEQGVLVFHSFVPTAQIAQLRREFWDGSRLPG